MKKVLAVLLIAGLVFAPSVSFAQKGANEKALEHANENAIFNRVGDWFATVGKSPEEKAAIKAERSAKRAAKRAEKEARKAEKKAKEKKDEMMDEAKEKKDKMMKGMDKAKGKMKKGS